jgi:hydrogenase/urease accessory protein HupE
MTGPKWRGALAGLLLALIVAPAAQAHIASNSFVSLTVTGALVTGAIEISIRDAELVAGIDTDQNNQITWGELRSAQPTIVDYVGKHLAISAQGGSCPLRISALKVNQRIDGNYVWLPIAATCPAEIHALELHYSFLDGIDPLHRGLLTLQDNGMVQTGVLRPAATVTSFNLLAPTRGREFVQYFQAGVSHILSGIDHLLFLFSLLLPAVLLRKRRRWEPVIKPGPAFKNIIKVVTAFTLAHSITLSLAALNVVRLPSRLTESIIAASIVIAALNNIFPVVTESRARIAFAFGLLHGFGFASVLADMGLPQGARVLSLLGFNLGIEAGQLAVVTCVMPIVYALRYANFYRRAVLPWASAAIAVIAFVWLVQRAVAPS